MTRPQPWAGMVTMAEAAQILGVTPRVMARYWRHYGLVAHGKGRWLLFKRADVEAVKAGGNRVSCIKDSQWTCHCCRCRKARYPELHKRAMRKCARNKNNLLLDQAHRHGAEWTGAELEIATRTDLTTREIALLLGRSYHSVNVKRSRIAQGDPRLMRMLGYTPASRPTEGQRIPAEMKEDAQDGKAVGL